MSSWKGADVVWRLTIASDANDLEAMEHIDSQINECVGLMYNLGP